MRWSKNTFKINYAIFENESTEHTMNTVTNTVLNTVNKDNESVNNDLNKKRNNTYLKKKRKHS